MKTRIATAAFLALVLLPSSSAAKVYPVGLTLKDAQVAAIAFASTQSVPGVRVGTASATCKTVSWMAARCGWTQVITPRVAGQANSCSGTVSVVRQQVKGYPLKMTRVAGTKVTCRKVTLPA